MNTEQQAELSELLDVLSGPPGWKADLESFITQALESRENSKVQIVHVEHKEIGGETFTCLYDNKGEKYLHLKKYGSTREKLVVEFSNGSLEQLRDLAGFFNVPNKDPYETITLAIGILEKIKENNPKSTDTES